MKMHSSKRTMTLLNEFLVNQERRTAIMKWNEFKTLLDLCLPNEVHASDDDNWDDYEAVNDPASGKKLPNEVHASFSRPFMQTSKHSSVVTDMPIYITETFVKDISEIYGSFSPNDDEYPAMWITIEGAPIFVECVRFPDCAIDRNRMTDGARRGHPAVGELWQDKLSQYKGKCRTSTVHIHPMNFPSLSVTDVSNFDSLRQNPDDSSTFGGKHPFPVILVNLLSRGKFEILGFWVTDGRAFRVKVKPVSDNADIVKKALCDAEKMPYFTEYGEITRRIDRRVSKEWDVELGVNSHTGAKAIMAQRSDGKKVLICFDADAPFRQSVGGAASRGFCFDEYVDWTRLFNDLTKIQDRSTAHQKSHEKSDPSHSAKGPTECQTLKTNVQEVMPGSTLSVSV